MRFKPSPKLFLVWLAVFYAAWVTLVVYGDYWGTVIAHYGIAVAMAFGSYVAGSTPMGGGTVGFPILVLLFGEPATLGRDFSFAVQSIGMTSASIFILCRGQPLEWVILRWAVLGTLIGTPLGIFLVAPHVPEIAIKIFFAIIWASFGVLHLYRTGDICANIGETPAAHRFDRNVGFTVGLLVGACVASITGVGIDMILYAVMVLLMRADLKVAIPSSVILMAFTSLVGIAVKLLFTGVQPGVFGNWLSAAPIVAIGAPFGAFIVSYIGRRPTLIVVAVLCVFQFLWTMQQSFSAIGRRRPRAVHSGRRPVRRELRMDVEDGRTAGAPVFADGRPPGLPCGRFAKRVTDLVERYSVSSGSSGGSSPSSTWVPHLRQR